MKKILFILLTIQILFATGVVKDLNPEDSVETSIVKMEKHFYKVTVPKNRSLKVDLLNLTADIDLYVRAKDMPSIRVNDCYSSNSNLKNESCTLNNGDKESDYYILVYGYEEGNYRVDVSVGELEKIDILIEERVISEIYLDKGKTKDYRFSAKKGEKVTVKLYGLSGDADLRLKIGRKANRHTFDCKSINGGTKEDICSLTLKEDAWVYVQVDGYRRTIFDLKLEYDMGTDDFLEKISSANNARPEMGLLIKYSKDKKRAYVFVDYESIYSDKHKGLTIIDMSDKEHPTVINYTSTIYKKPYRPYITQNGKIMTFLYISKNPFIQSLASLNLETLELVEKIIIGKHDYSLTRWYRRAGKNLDLFYTTHATVEDAYYRFYYISETGDITRINNIREGGGDVNYIWKMGLMSNNRFYIIYRAEPGGGPRYKDTKKIYDISNLPEMVLIDSIVIAEGSWVK